MSIVHATTHNVGSASLARLLITIQETREARLKFATTSERVKMC